MTVIATATVIFIGFLILTAVCNAIGERPQPKLGGNFVEFDESKLVKLNTSQFVKLDHSRFVKLK